MATQPPVKRPSVALETSSPNVILSETAEEDASFHRSDYVAFFLPHCMKEEFTELIAHINDTIRSKTTKIVLDNVLQASPIIPPTGAVDIDDQDQDLDVTKEYFLKLYADLKGNLYQLLGKIPDSDLAKDINADLLDKFKSYRKVLTDLYVGGQHLHLKLTSKHSQTRKYLDIQSSFSPAVKDESLKRKLLQDLKQCSDKIEDELTRVTIDRLIKIITDVMEILNDVKRDDQTLKAFLKAFRSVLKSNFDISDNNLTKKRRVSSVRFEQVKPLYSDKLKNNLAGYNSDHFPRLIKPKTRYEEGPSSNRLTHKPQHHRTRKNSSTSDDSISAYETTRHRQTYHSNIHKPNKHDNNRHCYATSDTSSYEQPRRFKTRHVYTKQHKNRHFDDSADTYFTEQPRRFKNLQNNSKYLNKDHKLQHRPYYIPHSNKRRLQDSTDEVFLPNQPTFRPQRR
jgi:hypothetical protein